MLLAIYHLVHFILLIYTISYHIFCHLSVTRWSLGKIIIVVLDGSDESFTNFKH